MKRKTLATYLLLFLSATMYAGDTTQVKPAKRLYAGVSYVSNVTYRYLRQNYVPYDVTAAEERRIVDIRNEHEHPQFGFQIGGRLGVNITRYFSLETGVEYNLHRYLYKSDFLTSGSTYNPSLIDTSITNCIVKQTDNYHYLNIPVAANFMLGKRKIKAVISAGVNFNFLLKKTQTFRYFVNDELYRSNTTADNYTFSSFNLSPFLGVGIDYHINRFMFLRIMPVAQMQALKNIDTPITEHLWSAGLNTSLFFGFLDAK
jgi:hypothetical protein